MTESKKNRGTGEQKEEVKPVVGRSARRRPATAARDTEASEAKTPSSAGPKDYGDLKSHVYGIKSYNRTANIQMEKINRVLDPLFFKPEAERTAEEKGLFALQEELVKSVQALDKLSTDYSEEEERLTNDLILDDSEAKIAADKTSLATAEKQYYDALLKAITDAIAEYKKTYPEEKEVIHDLLNRTTLSYDALTKVNDTKEGTPRTIDDAKQLIQNINSAFYNLYSLFRKGAHPFTDLLDQHLQKNLNPLFDSRVPIAEQTPIFKVSINKKGHRELNFNEVAHKKYYEGLAGWALWENHREYKRKAQTEYLARHQGDFVSKFPRLVAQLKAYAEEVFEMPAIDLYKSINRKANFSGKENLNHFLNLSSLFESKGPTAFKIVDTHHSALMSHLRATIEKHVTAMESKPESAEFKLMQELRDQEHKADEVYNEIRNLVKQIATYNENNMSGIDAPFKRLKECEETLIALNNHASNLRDQWLKTVAPELSSTVILLKAIEMAINTIYVKALNLKIPEKQLEASILAALQQLPTILDQVKDAKNDQEAAKAAVEILVNMRAGQVDSISKIVGAKKGVFSNPMETILKDVHASIDKMVPKPKMAISPGGPKA